MAQYLYHIPFKTTFQKLTLKMGGTENHNLWPGDGYISGRVLEGTGVKTDGIVELYDAQTKQFVKSTTTDILGEYRFDNIDRTRYFDVIAVDPPRVWEKKISSYRRPGFDFRPEFIATDGAFSSFAFATRDVMYAARVMSYSPAMYLRLNDPSGATAADNIASGADGFYTGSGSLGNLAIYNEGPRSYKTTTAGDKVQWPDSAVPALTEMTLGIIVNLSSVTGTHQLISRDQDSTGDRYFQWRLNGTNIEFVKVKGGVETVAFAHSVVAGTSALLICSLDSAGTVKLYQNSTLLGTGAVTAGIDYGGSTASPQNITIANRGGATSEAIANDSYSEAFIIPYVLTDAQVSSLAAEAGF